MLRSTSVLFFSVAFAAACAAEAWWGATVVLCNICTSCVVHRPLRASTPDTSDRADAAAIAALVAYNLYILCVYARDNRVGVFAVLCAVCVYVCDVARQRYPLHSVRRVTVHATMHFIGAVGTACLFLAIR
jgi:hypothetical protein